MAKYVCYRGYEKEMAEIWHREAAREMGRLDLSLSLPAYALSKMPSSQGFLIDPRKLLFQY